MPEDPPASERRASARARTLLRGRICHGPHFVMSIPCTVRNLTPGGALLQLPDQQTIPLAFALLNVSDGVAYDATVVWRQDRLAGVTLGERHDLRQPASGDWKSLRAIWLALASG